mgnify:CR=1 FL=1
MNRDTNIVMGLDIGSSKICAAVCEIDGAGELHVRGIGTSISAGLDKGRICDPEELQRAIRRAISKAEQEARVSSSYVIASIPLYQVQFVQNLGIFLSKEESGQISLSDQKECLRRSKNIVKASDQTMVHVMPLYYKVDGVKVKNPLGVFGKSLEVQTQIVLAHSDTLLSLTNCLKQMNLHISGLVYDGLASAEILLNQSNRKKGCVFVDMGGRFTKICFFKDNCLNNAFISPIGSDAITHDIAHCLAVSIPEAERLKIIHSDVFLDRVDAQETIEITTKEEGRKSIKKLLLCQIVEARLVEIFESILPYFPSSDARCPVVLGGGGALLNGLALYLQQKHPFCIEEKLPEQLKSIVESTSYASAVGLVCYGLKTNALSYQASFLGGYKRRMKQWIKSTF